MEMILDGSKLNVVLVLTQSDIDGLNQLKISYCIK